MASFSELVELYKSNGLSPLEAVNVARQEQALEHEFEQNRIQEEKRIESERLKWEAEQNQIAKDKEADRQNQFELQKMKLEMEQSQMAKDRETEHELKKLQLEHEADLNAKRIELQRQTAQHETDMRRIEIESRARVVETRDTRGEGDHSSINFRKCELGLGRFVNVGDELEGFILKFETVARCYKLPQDLWSTEILKCLWGESLTVYETLSVEHRMDYKCIVDALRRHFGLTLKSFRKRFLQAKVMTNENLYDFADRLKKYFVEWVAKAEYTMTVDDLVEHVIKDRFFESQSQALKLFLKERGKRMKLSEMVSLADDYQEAHEYFENNGNEKNENRRNQNKTGYQKRFGFRKNESSSFEPKVDQKDQKPDESKVETEVKQSGTDIQGGFKKKPIICFNCNKPGHKKDQCYSKPNQNRSFNWKPNSAAACQIMTSRVNESESDDMSDDEGIPCRSWPILSAMKGYDSDRCNDLHYPLRGAAEVNKQKVKFLRDTGSSICIVKQKFVKPE